ncbi:hypothetical protein AMYBAR_003835 [Amycolatopsis bartoniae]|nr:hypothetical protein [Amycolatopsis bartoniae]
MASSRDTSTHRGAHKMDSVGKVVNDVRDLARTNWTSSSTSPGFDITTSPAIGSARKRGRVVQVGLAKPTVTFDVRDLVLREVQLLGSVIGTTENLISVVEFIKDRAISSRVETLSFEQIGEGYDRMKRGDHHGPLVALYDQPAR